MSKSRNIPFHNLQTEAWQNLAMLALFVFYLGQVSWSFVSGGPLAGSVGSDFRAFWSAGYIANTSGYASVYDLARMAEVQKQIAPPANSDIPFEVAPVQELPIFITVLQVFALIPPLPSYIIWFVLNLIGYFLYIRFFLRKLEVTGWQRLAIMGVLAFPSYKNLYDGQINLPLLICVGEFIRQVHDRRDFRAGLWLGGLILKPQLLILIGPVLLLQRKWKLLGGFSTTVFVTLVSSLLLGKMASFIGMADIYYKFSSGLPNVNIVAENMMNWRMLAIRLGTFLPMTVSWGIAAAGMAATVLLTFILWQKPGPTFSTGFLIAFTGTLAATLAVTWHSHNHMAMVLIPPLLYLYAKKILPGRLFNGWVFGLLFVIEFITLPVKLLGLERYNALPGLTGFCMLTFNMIFLVWACQATRIIGSAK
jgi:hypothetical protein